MGSYCKRRGNNFVYEFLYKEIEFCLTWEKVSQK